MVVIYGTNNEKQQQQQIKTRKTNNIERQKALMDFFSTLIFNLAISGAWNRKALLNRQKSSEILRKIKFQVAFKYDVPSEVVTSGAGN